MFSRLSSGVKNAPWYDQAARTVACMAEILRRADRHPVEMEELSYCLVAPRRRIEDNVFADELARGAILRKVRRRVEDYAGARDDWFRDVVRADDPPASRSTASPGRTSSRRSPSTTAPPARSSTPSTASASATTAPRPSPCWHDLRSGPAPAPEPELGRPRRRADRAVRESAIRASDEPDGRSGDPQDTDDRGTAHGQIESSARSISRPAPNATGDRRRNPGRAPMDHFHYRDRDLYCEDLPVAELAERFGTPLVRLQRRGVRRPAEGVAGGVRRARSAGLLLGEGELEPRDPEADGRARQRLRRRLGRRAVPGRQGRGRGGQDGLRGRRQDGRGDPRRP